MGDALRARERNTLTDAELQHCNDRLTRCSSEPRCLARFSASCLASSDEVRSTFSKTDVPKPRRLGQASCSMLMLATDHVVCSAGYPALSPRAHAPSSQRGPTALRIGTWTCGGCGYPWLVQGQRGHTCVGVLTHGRVTTGGVRCGALLATDKKEELLAKCMDSTCHSLLFWFL
jgi:hypothetical protein